MIVNQHQKGWEVIYHRAHALLAAQLAGHWHRKDRPERLIETVAAISHHDDLEREWEGANLAEAGAPLDFTLDKAYAFFQWCDRLSLILCQRELPAGERALEISIGPDGKRYDVMQRSDVKFDSSAVTKALQTAPIKVLQWTFAK